LQIGASAGTSVFFGDLKQNNIWPISNNNNEWRFAYGLDFSYGFSPVFTFRSQVLYGELSGSIRSQNIWFENDYLEMNLSMTLNFNNLFGRNREDRLVNLYGTTGFGMINFNSVVKRMDEYYVLKRVGYGYGTGIEGRERNSFLMVGAGIDFRVSQRFDIILETSNNYVFTDLLDGTESGKYNDVYNYTSIGIVYRFAFLKKSKIKSVNPDSRQITSIHSMIPQSLPYQLTQVHGNNPIIKFKKLDVTNTKAEQEETYPKIIFRIQILAEYGKPYPIKKISEKFNISESDISENLVNNYYVYTIGSYTDSRQAIKACYQFRAVSGNESSFVVAFRDGKRIFPVKK
jgi:hypothetical protein